jgi:hypothetical protein
MRNPHAAGAGASNRLDSRDETPTRNTAEIQPKLDPIDIFMPWADDEEKALRKRVRWTHHAAAARGDRSPSGEARTVFWLAAQTASGWTTARASKEQLWLVLHTCSQLLMAGNNYELLEGGDA